MDDINRREVASAAGALLAMGTLTGAKRARCPERLLNPNTKVPPEFSVGETPPVWAIVREVDLEVNDKEFFIRFTGGSNRVPVPSAIKLQELLRKCATGMHKFDSSDPGALWPKPRPNSNEDISSPISLNVSDDNYWVIFILANRDRWRFQNKGSPLTIEDGRHNHYRQSRRVKIDGTMIEDKDVLDDCRVALFAALASKRKDAKDYTDSINLHLDFVMRRINEKEPYMRVKVIIDPDIRNPGGSSL
jgi:hypothetical protein